MTGTREKVFPPLPCLRTPIFPLYFLPSKKSHEDHYLKPVLTGGWLLRIVGQDHISFLNPDRTCCGFLFVSSSPRYNLWRQLRSVDLADKGRARSFTGKRRLFRSMRRRLVWQASKTSSKRAGQELLMRHIKGERSLVRKSLQLLFYATFRWIRRTSAAWWSCDVFPLSANRSNCASLSSSSSVVGGKQSKAKGEKFFPERERKKEGNRRKIEGIKSYCGQKTGEPTSFESWRKRKSPSLDHAQFRKKVERRESLV